MEEEYLKEQSPVIVGGSGADDVLISLIGEGDQAALARLYKTRSRFIYSLALSILRDRGDAEEITEEVFVKIWQNAAGFDIAKGSPAAWMATITRRLAIDRTRSKGYKGRMREVDLTGANASGESEAMISADADTTSAGAEAREVTEALERLGETHRQLIRLSYYEGLSHSMIAERLKTPLGTVKTRMREAVNQLRNILDVKV